MSLKHTVPQEIETDSHLNFSDFPNRIDIDTVVEELIDYLKRNDNKYSSNAIDYTIKKINDNQIYINYQEDRDIVFEAYKDSDEYYGNFITIDYINEEHMLDLDDIEQPINDFLWEKYGDVSNTILFITDMEAIDDIDKIKERIDEYTTDYYRPDPDDYDRG